MKTPHEVHGHFEQEDDLWLAIADNHPFVTSGSTQEEAYARMQDLADGFFYIEHSKSSAQKFRFRIGA
ncbi:MAG: hypothetical protein WEB00_02835 [Dehalococcoidia bacterium]